jgi:hypothetical protein
MNPLRTLTLLLAGVLAAVLGLAAPAAAAGAGDPGSGEPPVGLTWRATIDGRDAASATANDPIALPAGRDLDVNLSVENLGTEPMTVRGLRLEGRVIGMSFFSFTSQIDLTVAPGGSETRAIALDLGELGDQAVGLIPARLSLLAPDRTVIDDVPVATDVRGSLWSAYGLFGLAVGAVTLVLLVGLALEIAARRLPPNRWRRAVRFLAPGLGIGLVATFTLSATRLLLPGATVWVPLVLGCGAVAFVIGYLTPAPPDWDEGADAYVGHHRGDQAELEGYPGRPELDDYPPPPELSPRHPSPEAIAPADPPRFLP